jgi:hypothetical protein
MIIFEIFIKIFNLNGYFWNFHQKHSMISVITKSIKTIWYISLFLHYFHSMTLITSKNQKHCIKFIPVALFSFHDFDYFGKIKITTLVPLFWHHFNSMTLITSNNGNHCIYFITFHHFHSMTLITSRKSKSSHYFHYFGIIFILCLWLLRKIECVRTLSMSGPAFSAKVYHFFSQNIGQFNCL